MNVLLCTCWKSLQFNEIIEMLDDHVMKNLFYRMNSKDDLQAIVQYMYIKHKYITKSAIFI